VEIQGDTGAKNAVDGQGSRMRWIMIQKWDTKSKVR